MKIGKNYKGLIEEKHFYTIEENIETDQDLEIELDKKRLYIKGFVKVGGQLKSSIELAITDGVEVGKNIRVESGSLLSYKGSIVAGGDIYVSYEIIAFKDILTEGSIECERVKTGQLRGIGPDINLIIGTGGVIRAKDSIKAEAGIDSGSHVEAGKDIEVGGYEEGRTIFGETVQKGVLRADGYVKSGGEIVVAREINSSKYIKAGGDLTCGMSAGVNSFGVVIAREGITVSGDLHVGYSVISKSFLKVGGIISVGNKIICEELVNGEVIGGVLEETSKTEEILEQKQNSPQKKDKRVVSQNSVFKQLVNVILLSLCLAFFYDLFFVHDSFSTMFTYVTFTILGVIIFVVLKVVK